MISLLRCVRCVRCERLLAVLCALGFGSPVTLAPQARASTQATSEASKDLLTTKFPPLDRPSKKNTTPFDRNMQPVTLSQIKLETAEYWTFEGNVPFRYPDDVIRGFYPFETPVKTLDCIEQGYDQVVAYLRSDPPELRSAIAKGVTRSMILLINDYTLAAIDRIPRLSRLSHWGWGERDLSQGYWRWEITLTRDGHCHIPRISTVRETFYQAATR